MHKIFTLSFAVLFYTTLFSQTSTPAKVRLSVIKTSEESRFSSVPSVSIGPTIMGGRVTDIEVNPENSIEMFVAYASGGLWYTNNNGQSFRPIFDNQHSITIGDIAVDWKKFTVWVGTGESNSSRSSYAGTGVYRSNDTGHTWKHLGLEESHHIGKILVHPTNSDIVYVAVLGHLYTLSDERGIYKSVDGGDNWKKILFIDNKTGFVDMCFDPSNPEILIASSWERLRTAWNFKGSGPGSGIYLSKNNGDSWTKIYSEANTGRIGLASFSKNGRTGVYAIKDDQNSLPESEKDTSILLIKDLIIMEKESAESFLKLNNKKLNAFLVANNFPKEFDAESLKASIKARKYTLKDVINFTGDANKNLFQSNFKGSVILRTNSIENIKWEIVNDSIKDLYYTYGYYFGQISVAPANPDEVYILGVVLAHSNNGGKTFSKLNDENVHGDHHVLWIDPKNASHIINGNDGGLNISYDKGMHWVKCNTPAVGQFYAITTDEVEPYNVYGGLQDNGVWKGSINYASGTEWQQTGKYPYEFILGGDGMQVAVDTKQQLVYTGFQFGNYYRLNIKNKSQQSITPRHTLGEFPYRFNWQTPIQLTDHVQNTLYFGGNFLFRSFDQGDTWLKISPDLTFGAKEGNVPFGTISTLHESPLKFGLIYTGSDDGSINITKDGGTTWTNISIPAYKGYWISRIQASKYSEAKVYITINGFRNDVFNPMVFVSENYGKSWKSISSNLPMEPVNVIREDAFNAKILYLGTDNGLYISMNTGISWEKFSSLPRVAVHDLAIQKKANELIVGTHGRSLYAISLREINKLDSFILSNYIYLFDIPAQKASLFWGSSDYFWSPPFEQNMLIPFYSRDANSFEFTIFDSSGISLGVAEILAPAGLKNFKYNFTANQNHNFWQSKQVYKGKNGVHYLTKGKYSIQLRLGEMIVKKEFVILPNGN